ncbi:putative androgen-induced 1 protein [Scophthalmus maximus]|uniref:Putative androgen-induced 1 protein n=1 Tax=Scophthalmus maximus TaxID=52904 RepID=A0A2U9CUS8_SCOMX|nr:putative androgen-induced 1 protein [Scophthalmus maximus]
MALIPSQVLRVAILLSYFSILCHYKALDMPAHQTYGGSWKFLTFIDLVIQAVFFGLCVLIDVSSLLTKGGDSREQERQLRKLIGLRDWMMAVLAFPVGAFVVFTFWSLYLYDRELVYPKLLDNFIPQWLNHGMVSGFIRIIISNNWSVDRETAAHQTIDFVVFTFWSLYLYDRELVYPKLLDNFIPQWLNHGMVSGFIRIIISNNWSVDRETAAHQTIDVNTPLTDCPQKLVTA